MSISKGIVEELGGSISFETEVGVGTTFFVDVPEAT
jgi:signal transduction histidine kinase